MGYYKHGLSKHPLYHIWQGMKDRCYNKNCQWYRIYGGKGINVCGEWRDDFTAFYRWAIMNGYESGLSIDRIDGNGDYSPDNCRWASPKVQSNNTCRNHMISAFGKTQNSVKWAEETGIPAKVIYARVVDLHWNPERAVSEPYRRKFKQLIAFGRSQSFKQWSVETGIPVYAIRNRINHLHWSPEQALSAPYKKRRSRNKTAASI